MCFPCIQQPYPKYMDRQQQVLNLRNVFWVNIAKYVYSDGR